MVLEFYYDNLSQPCRAVYLFLKGTGVTFEPKVIELLKGKPSLVETQREKQCRINIECNIQC